MQKVFSKKMEKILVIAQQKKPAVAIANYLKDQGHEVDIAVDQLDTRARLQAGEFNRAYVEAGACLARAATRSGIDFQLFDLGNIICTEDPKEVLSKFKPYNYKAPEEELSWDGLTRAFHEQGYAITNLPGSEEYFAQVEEIPPFIRAELKEALESGISSGRYTLEQLPGSKGYLLQLTEMPVRNMEDKKGTQEYTPTIVPGSTKEDVRIAIEKSQGTLADLLEPEAPIPPLRIEMPVEVSPVVVESQLPTGEYLAYT